MLNIYLLYVSSLETGDVDVSQKVYTSFSKAVDNIDTMIHDYVTERNSENNYQIISKRDFNERKINKDPSISLGSYCFCKKKSSAWIYKKTVVEGKLWNSSKLEKVGKIGILSEINIPIDSKLLRLIKFYQFNQSNVSDDLVGIHQESEESEDLEDLEKSDSDNYTTILPNPSNYEHGKHVSFIHELKDKLKNRRSSLKGFMEPTKKEKINTQHLMFVNELNSVRQTLNQVTPPISPRFGLGRVIETPLESPVKTPIETKPMFQFIKTESTEDFSLDSSELTDSTDSYESSDLSDSIIVDESKWNEYQNKKNQTNHIESVIDDIMRMIDNSKILDKNIGLECNDFDLDSMDSMENIDSSEEWDVVEYYEGVTNSDPVKRKYIKPITNFSFDDFNEL